MPKLLIAENSTVMVGALERELGGEFEIRSCLDGNAAQRLLTEYQPDVLILNLMLPYRDGLTILQSIGFHPSIIIATTPYINSYILNTLRELGVDYTMICPTVKALCARLRDLVTSLDPIPAGSDPQERLTFLLGYLGFLPNWDGYRQLCLAVPLFVQKPDQRLTKELYPAVARLFGATNGACVERSIRKAIHTAFRQGDRSLWRRYFPPGAGGVVPCPSNMVFISRLAEIIRNS